MKRFAYLFILICINLSFAKAQHPSWQDTTIAFVKERGYLNDPIRSKWKSHIKKEGKSWVISLYDKKNIIQEQIHFGDEDLIVRKGPYIAYRNGLPKIKGQYDKGYRHGLWKYFDEKNHLYETVNYYYDQYQGPRITYWPNGQKRREENYSQGLLNGYSTLYYPNGNLASEEFYSMGKLQIGSKYLDPQGNAIGKSKISSPINYPGGIEALYKEIANKAYNYQRGLDFKRSTAVVRFKTSAAGEIEEIELIHEPSRDVVHALLFGFKSIKKVLL